MDSAHIQQPNIFVIPEREKKSILTYALTGGVIIGALWFGNKMYKEWKATEQEKKAGDDPATQQAIKLKAAMDGAGTSEEVIFQIAKEITDWKAVVEAYKTLYNGASLAEDLLEDLNPVENQKFYNILNLTQKDPNKPPKSVVKYSKGLIAVSIASVNVRKTPRIKGSAAKDKLLVLGRSNIIRTVDKGFAVGITTGRSSFDEKAEPSGVLFIEVQVLQTGALKNPFIAWVAASQVNTITVNEYRKNRLPALTVTKEEYNDANASLNGTEDAINYNREVVSISTAIILNDKFQPVAKAESNTILGYPVMELQAKNDVFVKFQTIDGTERWVSKKQIKINAHDTI